MPDYPTKEEIMRSPAPLHKSQAIKDIYKWKREIWYPVKRGTKEEKFNALTTLVDILNENYEKEVKFEYEPSLQSACYDTTNNTIYMDSSASIISTMHEFAHALKGPDEKIACRWSVHLFAKTFPIAFTELEWDGHMLKRSV